MLVLAVLMAIGCGTSGTSVETNPTDKADGGGNGVSSRPASDAGLEDASSPTKVCPRTLRDADAARFVVVSHPYGADGQFGPQYEVLKFEGDGSLSRPGTTFDMGTGYDAEITFTPDGRIGIAVQRDGSLGVFELSADGTKVRVVTPSFRGKMTGEKAEFYAAKVYVNASGTSAYILDPQIEANGGGIYEAAIGCDGMLSNVRKIAATNGIRALGAFHKKPERFLAAAGLGFGATRGDAHVVDIGDAAGSALVASTTVFPEATIVTSIAIGEDDEVGLLARSNGVAGNTEIGVVSFQGGVLEPRTTVAIEAPSVVLASPFGNAFFAASADPDGAFALRYDPTNRATPVSSTGKVAYKFGTPELPSTGVAITRGKFKGRILLAEVSAVRSMQFTEEGKVDDIEKFSLGEGLPNIVGMLGITP